MPRGFPTTDDQTLSALNFRVSPSGEIIDPDGGLLAGDVRIRMQSLEMRRLGTDRWEHTLQSSTNQGAECVRRQQEMDKLQIEHARIFG